MIFRSTVIIAAETARRSGFMHSVGLFAFSECPLQAR